MLLILGKEIFTLTEVTAAMRGLKSEKAAGEDEIQPKMMMAFLSLPGKVYAKCLERKCGEIVELKLKDGQCSFSPGRSTTDQIFTLRQIFEKSWEYTTDVFASFVDQEKAYDWVSRDKLWRVLQEYGI